MNLSYGKFWFFVIIYYILFYVENVLMVLFFVLWIDIDKFSWIFIVIVCVVFLEILFCMLFMVMYYRFCCYWVLYKLEDVE